MAHLDSGPVKECFKRDYEYSSFKPFCQDVHRREGERGLCFALSIHFLVTFFHKEEDGRRKIDEFSERTADVMRAARIINEGLSEELLGAPAAGPLFRHRLRWELAAGDQLGHLPQGMTLETSEMGELFTTDETTRLLQWGAYGSLLLSSDYDAKLKHAIAVAGWSRPASIEVAVFDANHGMKLFTYPAESDLENGKILELNAAHDTHQYRMPNLVDHFMHQLVEAYKRDRSKTTRWQRLDWRQKRTRYSLLPRVCLIQLRKQTC
jgi:hypothetical protein